MAQIDHPIYALCQGADENTLLVGGGGGKAGAGVPNGFKVCKFEDHKLNLVDTIKTNDLVTGIGYMKGKDALIAIGNGPLVELRNEKYETVATFDTKMEKGVFYRAMQFSEDGKNLLVVDGDNVLHVLTVPELKQRATYHEEDKAPIYTSFIKIDDKEQEAIVVGSATHIKIFVLEKDLKEVTKIPVNAPFTITPKTLKVKKTETGDVVYFAGFNPGQKASVVMKFAPSSDSLKMVKGPVVVPGVINSSTISGKYIACGTSNGAVILFTENLKIANRVQTVHGFPITSVAPLADYTATGGLDNLIILTPNKASSKTGSVVFAMLILIIAIFVHLYKKE